MKCRLSCRWMLAVLLLGVLLPLNGLAQGEWTEALCIAQRWNVPYSLSTPGYNGGEDGWKVWVRVAPDPAGENAMLLEMKVVDETGAVVTPDSPSSLPVLFLPFPQGHDAAMGYTYEVFSLDGSTKLQREAFCDRAIAFQPDAACATYRITWGNEMNPTACPWELVMSRMDWSTEACSYTVGADSSQVAVTRQGSSVTISGGEISSAVRFANQAVLGNDYQLEQGWHTEEGSYTFENVRLNDMVYVWAHDGENYRITLDASVKGSYGMICELRGGACLELVNNDLIRCDRDYSMNIAAEEDCSMSITGNGKILLGGGFYCDETGADVEDACPLCVILTTNALTQEDAMRRIRAFEGRVVVSYDQFETAGGYPPMRSFCMYRPIADDPFCTENVLDPQTGKYVQLDTGYIVKKLRPGAGAMTEPLLSAQSELDTAALCRPLLISPADGGEALYLRSEVTETVSGQSVEYEIHIVDDEDVHNALSGTGTLYLPYPEGMTMDSAAGYRGDHPTSDG